MNYTEEFKEIVKTKQYIGFGNPNSKILIVGKEAAVDVNSDNPLEKQNTITTSRNAKYWKKNIKKKIKQKDIENWVFDENQDETKISNNPLFAFKGSLKKFTSDTWKKYQKIYDLIFKGNIDRNTDLALDFQENFFITEMSDLPFKKTSDATKHVNFKENLELRKQTFFKSQFIQNFPIVILACNEYITNNNETREIDDIFNVHFSEEKNTGKQKYWTHLSNNSTPKLVIHTRQLSNAVEDKLLKGIANEIMNFSKKHNIKLS